MIYLLLFSSIIFRSAYSYPNNWLTVLWLLMMMAIFDNSFVALHFNDPFRVQSLDLIMVIIESYLPWKQVRNAYLFISNSQTIVQYIISRCPLQWACVTLQGVLGTRHTCHQWNINWIVVRFSTYLIIFTFKILL